MKHDEAQRTNTESVPELLAALASALGTEAWKLEFVLSQAGVL